MKLGEFLGIAGCAWVVALSLGCASRPEPPPTGPREIDLTVPESARDPFAGLTPCAEDETASCGPSREAPTPAPSADPATDTVWNVPIEPHDPQRGPRDALVTLVVFSDFECPYCKRVAPALEAIQRKHPRDVRLVWKDFPLPAHAEADRAAHFAHSVRAQKGDAAFWIAHDLLFSNQPHFDDETLRAVAGKVGGVDWARASESMRTKRSGPGIIADQHLAERLDVTLTPTTFVNGRKLVGALPAGVFDSIVAEELDKARALVRAGTPRSELYARLIAGGKQVEATSDLAPE